MVEAVGSKKTKILFVYYTGKQVVYLTASWTPQSLPLESVG